MPNGEASTTGKEIDVYGPLVMNNTMGLIFLALVSTPGNGTKNIGVYLVAKSKMILTERLNYIGTDDESLEI